MSKIFISYNRNSESAATNLVGDLDALGHDVWLDRELSGGQVWWEKILGHIRDCEVFVFVIDPRSLESVACSRECDYANALGKPVLPVLVADGVSTNLLRPEIAQLQIIDYRTHDRSTALRLARALGNLPATMPLPSPLPPQPEVPLSYLGGIAKKVDSTSNLSYEEQSALVVDLRRGLRDRESADDARVLLRRLRQRRDLLVPIAEEIDELLGPVLQPVRPVDPEPQAQTQHRVAVHTRSVPPSPTTKSSASPRKWLLFAVGIPLAAALTVIAFILAAVLPNALAQSFGFSELGRGYNLVVLAIGSSMVCAIVGTLVGLRRRTRVWTLVGLAVLILLIANNGSANDAPTAALLLGLVAGTAISLLVAAAWIKTMTRVHARVARVAADDTTAQSG